MKDIIITVKNSQTDRMSEICEKCKSDGMNIVNIFPFGVITGQASDDTISKLKLYEEFITVNLDKEVTL